ncbi:hypothetical protein [Pseudobutyrivibrio sp. YE44]|uniref:hypothetical protein n=1 Tax=Pseudobutyrivibrio sp. YE44 TaxID=1520802 RepID=UPI000B852D72|nr:hypothetical protein [Pseudobutyrivibrio sp. YE44]
MTFFGEALNSPHEYLVTSKGKYTEEISLDSLCMDNQYIKMSLEGKTTRFSCDIEVGDILRENDVKE